MKKLIILYLKEKERYVAGIEGVGGGGGGQDAGGEQDAGGAHITIINIGADILKV